MIIIGAAIVAGVAVLSMQQALPFKVTDPQQYGNMQDSLKAMSQKLEEVSGDVKELKEKGADDEKPKLDLDAIKAEISNLERELGSINSQIERLDELKDEVAELKKELEAYEVEDDVVDDANGPEHDQHASDAKDHVPADLSMSVYRAGESIVVTGTGLSDKPVRIDILDATGNVRVVGSTVSDSNGSFTFATDLSNFTAGTYTAKTTQEEDVVKKQFRVIVTVDTESG